MNTLLAQVLAWMVAEFFLSGIMLGLYFILRRATRAASDRYTFLRLGFLALPILPWIPFSTLLSAPTSTGGGVNSLIAGTVIRIRPVVESTTDAYALIADLVAGLYVFALAVQLGRLIVSLVKLRRLAAEGSFAFMHEGVEVHSTVDDLPPATFGLFKPIILISQRILREVDADELNMILEHELRHIRRRDYIANLGKALLQAVLVFSPFIHRLSRAFIEEMELSCDALVLAAADSDAKRYGSLLLRLATGTRSRTDLVYSGLFVSNSFISRRIVGMKSARAKSRKWAWVGAVCGFGLIGGSLVGSLDLTAAVASAIDTGREFPMFGYKIILKTANGGNESVSTNLPAVDGREEEIRLNAALVHFVPTKVDGGWKFSLTTKDAHSKEIVQSATLIISEGEEAHLIARSDTAQGDQLKDISIAILTPAGKELGTAKKAFGLVEDGDMVTLNFKEPTNIKDVIKVMARLGGKSVILGRDIEGKVTIVTDKPVPRREAYRAFVAALDQINISAVEEGKAIRLVKKVVN